MSYKEKIALAMMLLILLLWIFGGHGLGLGGPALLALLIPVLFTVCEWEKILEEISWDAWFMYCGALTLGALFTRVRRSSMARSNISRYYGQGWYYRRYRIMDRYEFLLRSCNQLYVWCRYNCITRTHCDSHGDYERSTGRTLGYRAFHRVPHLFCPFPDCRHSEQRNSIRTWCLS